MDTNLDAIANDWPALKQAISDRLTKDADTIAKLTSELSTSATSTTPLTDERAAQIDSEMKAVLANLTGTAEAVNNASGPTGSGTASTGQSGSAATAVPATGSPTTDATGAPVAGAAAPLATGPGAPPPGSAAGTTGSSPAANPGPAETATTGAVPSPAPGS